MGNSIEASADFFTESPEMIEELVEPFERTEVVEAIAGGIKTALEVVALGSFAAMRIFKGPSPEEIQDSDSEDAEPNKKPPEIA